MTRQLHHRCSDLTLNAVQDTNLVWNTMMYGVMPLSMTLSD